MAGNVAAAATEEEEERRKFWKLQLYGVVTP
jgi:hypothetical protein